jgi:phenylpropionate dioxygenase-like ring-hydroxylating dioxygenase large terminal subunit
MFLRGAWYPVAWEREIVDGPHAVQALGEQLVLFRTADGGYGALEDACPHRKVPLSMGAVVDGHLECGYHGLTFDCAGSCVKAPTNGSIPAGARVEHYAAHARYGLVWVWMGDPAAADPADIFHVEHWDDPAWGTTEGDDMVVECNYLYIVDNLLDPSHVAWVHVGSFAGKGSDETPLETTVADDGVTTWRWMLDSPAAPFYAPFLEFEGNCDRKQQYEMRYPSLALITAIYGPAGSGGEGRPLHPQTFVMDSYNFLTPIDERTTRYFWFQLRNVAPDDEIVSQQLATSVRAAFDEDKVVLAAVQRGIDRARVPPINLRSDTGGVRFRRRLEQLIDDERSELSSPRR